jgi:hypothetical protein
VIPVASTKTAHAMERALFDRGCAVAVTNTGAAAKALEDAGILAILVARHTGSADVKRLLQDLEHHGIVQPRNRVSEGGGI